jgi:hypothetical protein
VIKIYPNPAVETINVSVNKEAFPGAVKATLYGVQGEMLQTQILDTKGTGKFDVQGYAPGKYVVQFTSDKTIVAKTVVIIK